MAQPPPNHNRSETPMEVGRPMAPLLHQPVCWISTLHDTEDLAEKLGRGRLGGMARGVGTGLIVLVCTDLETAEV